MPPGLPSFRRLLTSLLAAIQLGEAESRKDGQHLWVTVRRLPRAGDGRVGAAGVKLEEELLGRGADGAAD
jgi:hypothetical protein